MGADRGDTGAVSLPDRRRRLFAAMAASCGERGYGATSVANLLAITGVSRAGFYAEFDNKLDCFTAMQEEATRATLAQVERRAAAAPPGAARAERALAALAELLVEQPAMARACMLEAFAAGPEARAKLAAAWRGVEGLLSASRRHDGRNSDSELPRELATALSGGILKLFQSRLIRSETEELPALAPRLAEWLLSQTPPPEPLRRRRIAGPLPFSPAFGRQDPVERILRATARCIAKHGYPATTVAEIAALGRLSQRTFYERFAGLEDATIAALDSSGAQLLATTLPALRRAADWPAAVREVYATMCGFMAAEPDFARLRAVEVYAVGEEAIKVRDRAGQELLAALLEDAPAERAATVDPVTIEMISSAAYATVYNCVETDGAAELPRCAGLLTYLTLAPIIGPEAACEAANADGRRR